MAARNWKEWKIHATLLFQAKNFFEVHKCCIGVSMAGRKWSVRSLEDAQPRIQLMTVMCIIWGRNTEAHVAWDFVCAADEQQQTRRRGATGKEEVWEALEGLEPRIWSLYNTELCNLIHFFEFPLCVLVPTQPAAPYLKARTRMSLRITCL